MRDDANLGCDDLLTAAETARLLRIHLVTLYSWVREGRIPSIKLGRKRLFPKRELDAWLEARIKMPAGNFRETENTFHSRGRVIQNKPAVEADAAASRAARGERD